MSYDKLTNSKCVAYLRLAMLLRHRVKKVLQIQHVASGLAVYAFTLPN